jgi:dTDP-4-dehydrorhamnose 3,5-epimerase
MDVTLLANPDVKLLRPPCFGDERGWFRETWKQSALATAGIDVEFTQDNEAWSGKRGTVRGLHFQRAPYAQAKLIRCVIGQVLDVAVDLRAHSPHFGKAVTAVLTAEGGEQLFVPQGFAHGYCTLSENTLVAYKVSGQYRPESEAGLLWNDPALAIEWPVTGAGAVLKDKDRAWPMLADLGPVFS